MLKKKTVVNHGIFNYINWLYSRCTYQSTVAHHSTHHHLVYHIFHLKTEESVMICVVTSWLECPWHLISLRLAEACGHRHLLPLLETTFYAWTKGYLSKWNNIGYRVPSRRSFLYHRPKQWAKTKTLKLNTCWKDQSESIWLQTLFVFAIWRTYMVVSAKVFFFDMFITEKVP